MFLHLSVILSRGVYPSMHWGRHPPGQTPPPQQTANAADGTHPTGMHSCLKLHLAEGFGSNVH